VAPVFFPFLPRCTPSLRPANVSTPQDAALPLSLVHTRRSRDCPRLNVPRPFPFPFPFPLHPYFLPLNVSKRNLGGYWGRSTFRPT
jgi:hypothetical protein